MKTLKCDICFSNDSEQLFKVRDYSVKVDDLQIFNIVRCRKCGLVYMNPQPNHEELSQYYGNKYYTHVPAGEKNNSKKGRVFKLLRWVKRKIITGNEFKLPIHSEVGRFLDVGCGKGNYITEYMKQYPQWEFFGIEPDSQSAKLASQLDSVIIINNTIKNAKFSDNFFDILMMNHSLEHIPNPSETLQECQRILKEDGKIIIRVPNFGSLAAKIFKQYWVAIDAPRHLFHFTEKTIHTMLDKAGFNVLISRRRALPGSISQSLNYLLHRESKLPKETITHLVLNYVKRIPNTLIKVLQLGGELEIIAQK
jgi:ubiquinone/menaquinone biosynthesis C-methylase UbiE